ncbi:MAG: HNH endonuclease [Nitrospiraceae bacterium]|nr:MAG: HNH endonuclease [Nitrospiraceae bacterium]
MSQNIPDSLKMILLEESGLQCAYCGHRNGLKLTHHHLDPKREGGAASYENLITLCRTCHTKAEKSIITAKELRRMKRLMVHRYLTIPAVNALKIAATTGEDYVVIFPFLVKHLDEGGYLEQVSVPVHPIHDVFDGAPNAVTYRITKKGLSLYEQWLKRSDDKS